MGEWPGGDKALNIDKYIYFILSFCCISSKLNGLIRLYDMTCFMFLIFTFTGQNV